MLPDSQDPVAPFEPVVIQGDSVTVQIKGKVLVLPTGEATRLPLFNEYVLNSNRLTIAESPFGGMKGSATPDYAVGTVYCPTSGVILTDTSGNNSGNTLSAGLLKSLNLLAVDTKEKTVTEEFIVANTSTATSGYFEIFIPDNVAGNSLLLQCWDGSKYNTIGCYMLDSSLIILYEDFQNCKFLDGSNVSVFDIYPKGIKGETVAGISSSMTYSNNAGIKYRIGLKFGFPNYNAGQPNSSKIRLKIILSYSPNIIIPVNIPSDFNWDWVPLPIFIRPTLNRGSTYFYTGLNIESYKITGKTYYVNVNSGNDTNDGLTANTPLANVATALAKTDVDVVILSPGNYIRNTAGGCGLGNITRLQPTRNVSIICPTGRAIFSLRNIFTSWTKHATYTNTYYVARSGIGRVLDKSVLDSNSEYTELTLKASIAEVNATANSWYTDNVSVYVHKQSGATPGDEICLFFGTASETYPLYSNTNLNIYLENIDFEGGYSAVFWKGGNLYAKNCSFKYAASTGMGNGLTLRDANAILENCLASKNKLDGFNYHEDTAHVACKVIELNCIGRDNGDSTQNSSNGSTSHELCKVIRINGEYTRNYGPNVADVLGSNTLNLNVYAHDSAMTDNGTSDADFYTRDFYTDNVSKAKMWLDSCITGGSFYPVYKGANCEVYELNTLTTDPRIFNIGYGSASYEFVNSFNDAYGLQNLAKPWIALYDPEIASILPNTTGNGNNGTMENVSVLEDSGIPYLSFNGSSSRVNCGTSLALATPFSIKIKLKFNDDNTFQGIIGKDSNNGWATGWFLRRMDINRLQFMIGNNTAYGGIFAVTDSTYTVADGWIDLEIVDDGTNISFYKNGVLDGTVNRGAHSILTNTDPLYIGFSYSTNYFNGAIKSVEILNDTTDLGFWVPKWATPYIDFYLFSQRPKNLIMKKDDTGNVYELSLYPGNGQIYHGRINNGRLTQDINSDTIPDCLDSAINGSVANFLQSYGFYDDIGIISFETTGATFSPVLTVDTNASILWNFGDGTTSTSATPTANFGTEATRVHTLKVTPWTALTGINVGYNGEDSGDGSIPVVANQNVTKVKGLQYATSLKVFCAAHNPVTDIDFSYLPYLETIECYDAGLTTVGLRSLPKVKRLCLESNALSYIDLSEVPALEDLRGALNASPVTVVWGATGSKLWHFCTRDNASITPPPLSQMPSLRELYLWGDGYAGNLLLTAPALFDVRASGNYFTSVTLSDDCAKVLQYVYLQYNLFPQDQVDNILAKIDTLSTVVGVLHLEGNAAPSATGIAHWNSLQAKGWTGAITT